MVIGRIGEALLMAGGMFWQVGWSLALGFLVSALLQVLVPAPAIARVLGRDGWREIAIAAGAGAASSSCSYAAASVSRALFSKGAALGPSLAYLFAATNLVLELGLVLYLLMGWAFMAGEWIGGVVLIVMLSLLVRLTYPAALVEQARRLAGTASGHDHAANPAGASIRRRLVQRRTWVQVAQSFVMEWSMLWKDLLIGFLVAGFIAAFIPDGLWQALFVHRAAPWLQLPANAMLGPLVAVLSFVCSIGNVPLAAVLWGAGVSFGGVLAFLFADLIALPLLDVYRRYYGWKMAAYMAAIFYVSMAASAIVMDLAFGWLGWIPRQHRDLHLEVARFAFDHTFWLNLGFAAASLGLLVMARRSAPATTSHCHAHQHHS